jgi:hypothetical protein
MGAQRKVGRRRRLSAGKIVVGGLAIFAVGLSAGFGGIGPSLDSVRSSMSVGTPKAPGSVAGEGSGATDRGAEASGPRTRTVEVVKQPKADPARGVVFDGLTPAKSGPCLGGYDVRSGSGKKVCSHGPDAPMPGLDPKKPVKPITAASPAKVSTGAGQPSEDTLIEESAPGASQPGAAPAAGTEVPCDGDGTSGNRVQVLYVYSGQNRIDEYLESFRTWSAGINTIYSASAKETGGERSVRFVTEKVGGKCRPTITAVEVSGSAIGDFGASIDALAAAGFDGKDRKYVMWADVNNYCGIGGFAGDNTKGAENRSNFGPSYGRSDNGCWSPSVAAHELGHNLGAVSNSAPNTSRGGHCVDEYDLMCYSDDPYYPEMVIKCNDRAADEILDCNHDDYYSTDPKPGSFLDKNFNVADNVFLIQGGGGGGGDDTTPPSVPTGLKSSEVTDTSVTLTWTAAKDDTGVTSYDVLSAGKKVASSAEPTLTVDGLTAATGYSFTVVASDEAGNDSKPSAALKVTTTDGGGGGGGGGLTIGSTGTLTNARTGRVADVARSKKADGASIIQYPLHGGPNQQWTVVDGKDGLLMIKSVATSKCLTVKDASKKDGAPVVQQPCKGAPEQLWKPTEQSSGFSFIAKHSGLQLGLGAARVDNWRVLAQRTPAPNVADTGKSRIWGFKALS